jgi:hypothetical protein
MIRTMLMPSFEEIVADQKYLDSRIGPRRFHYPYMIGLAILIAILIHLALPTELIMISANMSNFASLFFPIILMYLNSKLPKPAKATWWSYLVLILNVIFFGFFFLNFAWKQVTGKPIIVF